MNDLIHIHNQGTDLLADSREVAKVFDVQHKHLRELVEEHEEAFHQLGVWRFETAKPSRGSDVGEYEVLGGTGDRHQIPDRSPSDQQKYQKRER